MIAYLQLPLQAMLIDKADTFEQLRGITSWEVDSSRSAYFLLDRWMTKERVRELYHALHLTFGPHIRFGAAEQKTTARAAALYRAVPHCTIITPEVSEQFLAELPIRLLPGLGQRTTKYLARHGINTFSEFRGLSYQTLKDWFGVSGIILQQFAFGIDPRVVEPSRQRAFA
ncbi:MAG: hypothetical protein HY975_04370 [Candidatus Kerfeldbacteria bacterium]|nr:hypothetical protein [Candidatus Kerfeldbacteria bacterium]